MKMKFGVISLLGLFISTIALGQSGLAPPGYFLGNPTATEAPAKWAPLRVIAPSLNLYVTTGGNDANPCTVSLPCATVNRAWAVLMANYDLGGGTAIINVAAGTYTSCNFASVIAGMPVGHSTTNGVSINGASSATVTVNTTGCNGFTVGSLNGVPASVSINGMKLQVQTLNFAAIEVNRSATVRYGPDIEFPGSIGINIYTHTGGFALAGPPGYKVTGPAQYHTYVIYGGLSIAHGIDINCGGNTFAITWAYAGIGGQNSFEDNTFTNCASVTGNRFFIDSGGYALFHQNSFSGGGVSNYPPGNADGIIIPGGGLDSLGAKDITSTVLSGSAISLTASPGAGVTLTSVILQPGTYHVYCTFQFIPGAATVVQGLTGSVSVTTNTIDGTLPRRTSVGFPAGYTPTNTFEQTIKVGPVRFDTPTGLASEIFCVSRADFTPGTMTVYGMAQAIPIH